MKYFFLTLAFLATMAVQTRPAQASGATSILLSVPRDAYAIENAAYDSDFLGSDLYNILESAKPDIYVARVDSMLYTSAYYYAAQGMDVKLRFCAFEPIVFRYYPSLKALLGVRRSGAIVVLLQKDGLEEAEGDSAL